jgi:hypothetical protein
MFNTREIDRIAQNILQDSIPPAWLPRKQDPDIYIDYFIEIADMTGPTGIIFAVQLKGTASPKYSTSYIKLTMEIKHIAYYIDKVKQPLFIVVIDIINKKGYYLFVQEWVLKLTNNNWRNQKYIILNIPAENLITNRDEFREAIHYADNYMRDLWPSSISASINYEKNRLENLDQRFEVSISHNDGQTRYGLRPKENVNFKCQFKFNKNTKKGIIDYYNRGLPFSIEQTDILKIEGSKIIEEAFEKSTQGKVILGPLKKGESPLIISTLNELKQETSTLYINAAIFGGRKEFRIQGQLNESPLGVNILGKLTKTHLKSLDFEFNFELKKWEGLSILQLPFFEKIFSFLIAINSRNTIKMVYEIKGMRFIEGVSDEFNYETINRMHNSFNLLNKVRIIAKTMGINIIFPKIDLISRDYIDNIELVHDLITKGEYRRDGSNARFKAEISPYEIFFKEYGTEDTEKDLSTPLSVEVTEVKYNIFGTEIKLGTLRYILTNPRMIIKKGVNGKNILNNKRELILEGNTNSELIVIKI